MPMYLDDAGLEVAYIGLSNSVRESLRAVDMLTTMLDRLLVLFVTQEKRAAEDIRQLDQSVDLLSAAVRAYLADIGQDGLNDADADRAQEILMFIINVEHAGDIPATWPNWLLAAHAVGRFLVILNYTISVCFTKRSLPVCVSV